VTPLPPHAAASAGDAVAGALLAAPPAGPRGALGSGYDALRHAGLAGSLSIVIESFADAETARIWSGRRSRRLPLDIQPIALRKLRLLNRARALNDLRVPPGNRLEALKGDRRGQHSVRINQQWRICFRWHDGAAHDVEIVDDHD
jgi:toxin HigB-1